MYNGLHKKSEGSFNMMTGVRASALTNTYYVSCYLKTFISKWLFSNINFLCLLFLTDWLIILFIHDK